MVNHSRMPALLPYLIATYFFSAMAVAGGRVAASLYALHLGTSETLVGVLLGLYGMLPMLFSVAVGRWTDRRGPYIPMRIGVVILLAGMLLAVIAPQVSVLFVMAALSGIGLNLVTVAGQYAVGQLASDSGGVRVAHFGWFSLGQSSANVAGPILAGLLIDHLDYHIAFIVLAVTALCALPGILMQATSLRALHANKTVLPPCSTGVFSLIGNAGMQRIYVVGVLLSFSWDTFVFLIPILGYRQQLPAASIGAILAAFAAGTFSVRLMMPWLARRFSEWRLLRAAIVIIVMLYLLLPMTLSLPHAVLFLFAIAYLFGMAVGCSQPNMLALLYATAPPGRGAEAVGFRQMLCNASGMFAPLIFGAIAASSGLLPMFWSVAALMAAGFPAAHRETRVGSEVVK